MFKILAIVFYVIFTYISARFRFDIADKTHKRSFFGSKSGLFFVVKSIIMGFLIFRYDWFIWVAIFDLVVERITVKNREIQKAEHKPYNNKL